MAIYTLEDHKRNRKAWEKIYPTCAHRNIDRCELKKNTYKVCGMSYCPFIKKIAMAKKKPWWKFWR